MSFQFCDVGELFVETIGSFRFRYGYFVISKLDGLVGGWCLFFVCKTIYSPEYVGISSMVPVVVEVIFPNF